eukprot:scaffold4843_cov266-Chaetoceros_neogracile.AAC.11
MLMKLPCKLSSADNMKQYGSHLKLEAGPAHLLDFIFCTVLICDSCVTSTRKVDDVQVLSATILAQENKERQSTLSREEIVER